MRSREGLPAAASRRRPRSGGASGRTARAADADADARRAKPVREAWERYARLVAARASSPPFHEEAAERYRWLVEEFRVAAFAQALGTPEPASKPRLDRLWSLVTGA